MTLLMAGMEGVAKPKAEGQSNVIKIVYNINAKCNIDLKVK